MYSDNDKPSINASNESPVEGSSAVILTCNENIPADETVSSYEWFKGNTKVNGEVSKTYDIGNQRENGGNFTCKVVAGKSNTSVASGTKTIDFLCE